MWGCHLEAKGLDVDLLMPLASLVWGGILTEDANTKRVMGVPLCALFCVHLS